jgi:hypothetical protein
MATFSVLPADCSIEFVAGDYFAMPMTINSGLLPKDLTGYTFDAHIRLTNATVMAFTIDVQDQLTKPGQLILSLSMVQTATLLGDYIWEMDWLDIAQNRRSIISSTVRVVKNV